MAFLNGSIFEHRTIDESGIGYEYQPMSRKVEELDNLTFHYRTIRNHEKTMQDNGYYDGYYEECQSQVRQSEAPAGDEISRLADLEAQLAEAHQRIEELETQPSAAAEPTTTVNAAKWGNSVTAAFGVWAYIIAGGRTDWKEDEFRAALAERCSDYHTDVHATAWRLLPDAFKHGRGRPKKNPDKSQQSDNS